MNQEEWHQRRLRKLLEANTVDVAAFNAEIRRGRAVGLQSFSIERSVGKLYDKNCNGIDFESARIGDLEKAFLEHANLNYATFDYVQIKDASFRYATFQYASYFLSKVDISGSVDLSYADLRGIRLDRDYQEHTKELLYRATLCETKITPEQEDRLVSEFGIPAGYIQARLSVVPLEKERTQRLAQLQVLVPKK